MFMNKLGARSLMVAGLFGLAGVFSNAGCGGGGGGGSAGHSGAGGHAGTSGGGAGGHAGTGGSAAGTGGSAAGTGGSAAGTGGSAAGTGGSAAGSGGAAGSHTDGGTDATDASDGGAGTAAFLFSFDTNTQGWGVNTFGTGNLGAIDGGAPPAITWDGTVGSPTTTPAGSLKVTGTFTEYGQYILTSVGIAPWVDATGKTAHAMIRLDAGDAGAGTTFTANLQANSDGYHGIGGATVTLTAGTWTDVTLNFAGHAAPFDASKIIQLTIQLSDPASADGAAFPGPISPTFHIDTITDGSGLPAPPLLSHTFDKDTLGYTASGNAALADGGTGPTLTWDSAEGNPANGSLKVTATFTDYDQTVDVVSQISPLVNLTGKIVHVQVRCDSGALNGFAQIHGSTTTGYVYGSGQAKGLTASTTWTDLALDPTTITTSGWDTTKLIQLGVQFGPGGRPDGGTFPGPISVVVHVDSFIAQ
jgi:hypothetical protein